MKPRRVVDASVVAAAFLAESCEPAARVVLTSGEELHVPDLIYAEAGNAFWKRCMRGGLEEREVLELTTDLLRLPLVVTPSAALLESAVRLAVSTGRSVYDCVYLALAVRLETAVDTADERFVNSLADGPMRKYVRWIGV